MEDKPSFCSRFCGLVIMVAIIGGGGYCLYKFVWPKLQSSVNELTEALQPKEMMIHEDTGPFVWTLHKDGSYTARLMISGGVSHFTFEIDIVFRLPANSRAS